MHPGIFEVVECDPDSTWDDPCLRSWVPRPINTALVRHNRFAAVEKVGRDFGNADLFGDDYDRDVQCRVGATWLKRV